MLKNIVDYVTVVCICLITSLALINIILEAQYYFSCQHIVEVIVDGQKVFEGPAYLIDTSDRTVKIYKDKFRFDRVAQYTSPNLTIKTIEEK